MAEEKTRPRLGRGLAALLGDAGEEGSAVERARGQRRVPVDFLRANPKNPRLRFADEDLEDLAASVREKGVIQPILVRTMPGTMDLFEIIAGERRWRAAQKAGLHDVPVTIVEASDRESLELAIIENVQREDLNAIEEAGGYDQAARRVRLLPIRSRQGDRQEPKPCRQHAAPPEATGCRQEVRGRRAS